MNAQGQQHLAQMLAQAQGSWPAGAGMMAGQQMMPGMPAQAGQQVPPPPQQPPAPPLGAMQQNLQQVPQQPLQQQMHQQQLQPQQLQPQQLQPQMQMQQQMQQQQQQLQQHQMQQQPQQQMQQPLQAQQQMLQQRPMQQGQLQPQMVGQQMPQQQPQQPQQQQAAQVRPEANGASQPSKLAIGMHVEAQCVGWGPEWYPGVIRELLQNGEVQVLWDGDDPSISNVPKEYVKPKVAQPDNQSQSASGEKAAALAADGALKASSDAPTAVQHPAVASSPAPLPVAQDLSGQKRPHPDSAKAPVDASKAVAAAVARSYRYDLGPGDEIESPISNLRRRVEAELRDGLTVTISLHIVREPDAGVPPAPAPPSRPAPVANGTTPHAAPLPGAPLVATVQHMPKAAPGMMPGTTAPLGGQAAAMPGVPSIPPMPQMPQMPSMPGMGFSGVGGPGPLQLGMAPNMIQQGIGMAKIQP